MPCWIKGPSVVHPAVDRGGGGVLNYKGTDSAILETWGGAFGFSAGATEGLGRSLGHTPAAFVLHALVKEEMQNPAHVNLHKC